ncbi:HEPN domain-containing protein [Mucilaginibacter agri]|uniref:HEPN domain-containing protein n=1 Tax=Mucilaginibacter agri TaxID=2695265 RepID=A0A966DSK9_9SPHI|nr:HEPN domain-containing protein [Mucilaginibacter agri]NCD67884.1 HEPN domain-containing protein [Mucilaginibacter agri]
MYDGKYAPWDHYPKTLRFFEIQNPLIVITEFFSIGTMESHHRDLKEWRDCVIGDRYFNDKPHGPGTLIFIWEFNLKVLDAAYLMLLSFLDGNSNYRQLDDVQLSKEKDTWNYFPDDLSTDEQLDPHLALKKIFKEIKPQKFRDYLQEWLHAALYTAPVDESLSPGEIVHVYESMLKLYAACWLIYKRETQNGEPGSSHDKELEKARVKHALGIRSISPSPTSMEMLGLKALGDLIFHKTPYVEMIIHVGTHGHPFTFFLLALVHSNEKTPEAELCHTIEDQCKQFANVHILLHKTNNVKSALKKGNRFYSAVLKKGKIIYKAPQLEMPASPELLNEVIIARATFQWGRWGEQGKQLFVASQIYREKGNNLLAAYLLHQSVENILKGTIQAILGYRVHMHNLSRLLRITLLFTDELRNCFDLDNPEGAQLFSLLQVAYSQSRYSNQFDPDEVQIKQVSDQVQLLINTAEACYHLHVKNLVNPL